ncbi:MAG TPA: MBL fold metallo-hydrolase [Gemmatimonadales bacterium]|nr:MBL fold metallo-hydrolase [Gemmatimonadales bacterium]
MAGPLTVVNIGYRSTNFWVVSAGTSRLLVDLGWPGMVAPLLANLERKGVPLAEIKYGLATHYHIDHAGAAEDLKRRGMTLLVTEEQVSSIPQMKQWTKPSDHYTEISAAGNRVLACVDSRGFLAKLGIPGEIVHTPGHSDDSVTLVLDNGWAFTGDLTPESMVAQEDPLVVAQSWQLLRDRGATTVYGGHGPVHPLPPPE